MTSQNCRNMVSRSNTTQASDRLLSQNDKLNNLKDVVNNLFFLRYYTVTISKLRPIFNVQKNHLNNHKLNL